MIVSFSIVNYALIDRLEMNLSGGFTAITGETGAGKSILLGALSLVLGKRADTTVLRHKEKKCTVETEFDISSLSLRHFFEKHDLDYDDTTVLRREILPSGKSRAFINDTPVSLQILKELGERLVDIHSQHQTLLLGKSNFQLALLDDFANNRELLARYREQFGKMIQLRKETARLTEKKENAESERDYISFQLEELEAEEDTLKHFEEIREEEKRLSHTEEIAAGIAELRAILSENEFSALAQLGRSKEILNKLLKFHPDIAQLHQRTQSVWIELKDIVSELEIMENDVVYNPSRAEELGKKLDAVYRLQQKHRVQHAEELLRLTEEFRRRLQNINNAGEELETTKKAYEQALAKTEKLALELSEKRADSAKKLEKKIESLLKKLAMPHAAFTIEVKNTGSLNETGFDSVRFLFSANKGAREEEIAKIASGGELSRLMLALKAMVQQVKLLPTVIFDEIDSGVSGNVAGKIGSILKEMSKNIQVIAITHLPQIAAKADTHLKVYKEVADEQTNTRLVLLNDEERIYELATLISGNKVTPAALDAAKELMLQ